MAHLKGTVNSYRPFLKTKCHNGRLIIGIGSNKIKVDTGFDGGIVAPKEILNELNLTSLGERDIADFENNFKKKEVFLGEIKIREQIYEITFMEGDFLLGMELMDDVFKTLKINFENNKFSLTLR